METFKCSGENSPNYSCHFWKQKSLFLQILHQYSASSNILPSTLLTQTLYTLVKDSLLKSKFLRFSSARIKIRQISHVNFELTSQFLLNFFPNVGFEVVNSFSNFASFFIAIKHNSPLNFKLIHFLLGIKVPHKSPNFKFQLSSALVKICQIPDVIFQTTSQFFFSVFFLIKHYLLFMEGTNQSVHFWDFWVLGSKFTKFLSFLRQQIGFSSTFALIFSVMRHNSSVLF